MIQPHIVFKRVTTSSEAEILRVIRNKCRNYMTRSTEEITYEQQQEWFKSAFKKYELYIAYAVEYGACVVDADNGIASSPVHYRNDTYDTTIKFAEGKLPGVDLFTKTQICIPNGWWVTPEETKHIVNVLNSYSGD